MIESSRLGDQIFKHYLRSLRWLGDEEDAISAASAMRNIHFIAEVIGTWSIPQTCVSLETWVGTIDPKLPHDEVKERARWVLDSSVGDLLRLTDLSMGFRNEAGPSIMPIYGASYARLPDPRPILHGRLSRQCMFFLRHLVAEFRLLDLRLQGFVDNVDDMRASMFSGYMLATALHQFLSIVDYSRSWDSGE